MHDYGLIHPENLQTWASAQELSGTFMIDPSTLLGVPYVSPWLGIVTIIKKDINNAYGLYIFNYHDSYCCMSNAGKWTEPWVKLIPNKYPSNPNLLDNWYFVNPVNQRGKTEYTEAGYTVDRWIFDNDSETVTANLTQEGVRFSASSGATGIASLSQIINPKNFNALAGKTVTLSCLGKTDIAQQVLFYVDRQIVAHASSTPIDGVCMTTCTYTFPTVMSSLAVFLYARSISGAGEGSILATKLELGDTQTLAHKENGIWVLNEIPDFGEQLRRCMYYAEKIEDGNTPVITNATFIPAGATSATFVLPYERKRTYPSIRFNDVSNYRVIVRSMSGNTSAFGISNISILDVGTIKASVLVTFSSATSQDWYGYLQRSDNTSGGYAFISADL